MNLTPPSQWEVGVPYRILWICYMHDKRGVFDAQIIERLVLESEADAYTTWIRQQNKNCTVATIKKKRHWNGGHRLANGKSRM